MTWKVEDDGSVTRVIYERGDARLVMFTNAGSGAYYFQRRIGDDWITVTDPTIFPTDQFRATFQAAERIVDAMQ